MIVDIATSNFAQLVTQFRQQRGMSQGQLAQAARLSRTYIYHLEKGMRSNPSPRAAESIARALELQGEERRQLFTAYSKLTGQQIDIEQSESTLLDFGEMARLLVHNTSYPAHSLDRLWFLHSWNDATITLFEVERELTEGSEKRQAPRKRFPVQYANYDAFARIPKVMETFTRMARISSHCLGHLPRRQTRPFICLPDTAQPARTGNPTHSNHRFYGYLYLFDGKLCPRR